MTDVTVFSPGGELADLADARASLERARSLSEVKAILDVAVAARKYAEAKKLGEESIGYAQSIVNLALRRLGEMSTDDQVSPRLTLGQLGLTRNQSSIAQAMARVPEPVYEKVEKQPTKRVLRVAREAAAEERRKEPVPLITSAGPVTIWHGDFREVLLGDDLLAGSVDAIITDPPYPKEFIPLFGDLSKLAFQLLKPNGVLAVMTGQTWVREYLAELDQHMNYRWIGAYLVQGQRNRVHGARVGTGWKPILIYAHPEASDLPFILDDLFDSVGSSKDHHHWGQSESGVAALVKRLTKPGALVVDPFLGGGTTAVVCRDLGRQFIGCDIDAAHVATSRKRVA